jgi:hypothetical protein
MCMGHLNHVSVLQCRPSTQWVWSGGGQLTLQARTQVQTRGTGIVLVYCGGRATFILPVCLEQMLH